MIQWQKFRLIAGWLRPLLKLINVGYQFLAAEQTPINLAVETISLTITSCLRCCWWSYQIKHRMVTFIPAVEYFKRHNYKISHNHINKLDRDFTGFIEFKEWSGKGIYLLQYENGKKIRYLSLKKKPGRHQMASMKTANVVARTVNCWVEYIPSYGIIVHRRCT